MRTLFEIVEEVKDGGNPDYDEIKYALLVYCNLFNSEHRQLRNTLLSDKLSHELIRKIKAETSFNAYKSALNKSPKVFLGWSNDPENPEYQKMRSVGNKIVDKVLQDELPH